jgi:hypothetical protein
MDPNLTHEQRGIPANTDPSDEGVDYLRRLKRQPVAVPAVVNSAVVAAAVTDPAVVVPAKAAAASAVHPKSTSCVASASRSHSGGKDRRSDPRYPCLGRVELHAEGSAAPLLGKLNDISLRGCYVEMPTTFPVNTTPLF